MPKPLNKRPRKATPTTIDPELKKVLEDYDDGRVMYDTIQLQHVTFDGKPQTTTGSYYLVNHTDKLVRGNIHFLNFPFALVLPEVGSNQQTLTIALDNTDKLVQTAIEEAMIKPEPIKVIYRCYIEGSADTKITITLHVENISITESGVSLQCSRPDIYKRTYPQGVRYDHNFRGLMA